MTFAALLIVGASPALAQEAKVTTAQVDAAIKAGFPNPPTEFVARFTPDETMRACSAHKNAPPEAVAAEIRKREAAKIVYPADGKLMGDWKKGEKIAQSGYGMRFSDYPPKKAMGGNCYGCHQLSKKEVSYGTVGPSLLAYGKARDFSPAAVKAVYEKIYDSQAALPCSNMPRFGANKVLTIDQIKDAVALVMSPDSPVNK
jgi:sulfur-oxidizing protein SoxX